MLQLQALQAEKNVLHAEKETLRADTESLRAENQALWATQGAMKAQQEAMQADNTELQACNQVLLPDVITTNEVSHTECHPNFVRHTAAGSSLLSTHHLPGMPYHCSFLEKHSS
jgi:hypothetical protein